MEENLDGFELWKFSKIGVLIEAEQLQGRVFIHDTTTVAKTFFEYGEGQMNHMDIGLKRVQIGQINNQNIMESLRKNVVDCMRTG